MGMNPALRGISLRSQRDSELIPALFGAKSAPICALIAKLAKKSGENGEESTEKWREMYCGFEFAKAEPQIAIQEARWGGKPQRLC